MNTPKPCPFCQSPMAEIESFRTRDTKTYAHAEVDHHLACPGRGITIRVGGSSFGTDDGERLALWNEALRPNTPRYFVLQENSLGFVYAEQPTRFNVLASGIGGPDWKQGFVPVDWEHMRMATLADFERFRVDPKGHLT